MPPDDPGAATNAPQPQRPDSILPAPYESFDYLEMIPVRDPTETSAEQIDRLSIQSQDNTSALQDPILPAADGAVGVITPRTAYQLALVNSRDYQDRKEGLYLAALDVTLEQYSFAPQWFMTWEGAFEHLGRELGGGTERNRLTSASGPSGTTVSPGETDSSSAFNGQTVDSFAGAGPLGGSGFGFGKLFASGAALLLRFANVTVWELSGAIEDESQSFLAIEAIQPLLQGGNRAVTLEPLTQAERNLLYEIRGFARFEREFVVSVLTGSDVDQGARLEEAQESDEDLEGRRRKTGVFPLFEQLQVLKNEQQNLKLLEAFQHQFDAFHRAGEVSLIQLDQVRQDVALAQSRVLRAQTGYYSNLDRFKIQLGLPTRLPIEIDESVLQLFAVHPDRCELPNLPATLPEIPYELDEAIDLAMENRLDLMNIRANLVDYWRKVAVAANGLEGVLDLRYEGDWSTPTNRNQPFNFSSERASHRISLNTELPLVRQQERNIYRATLIEYQQARRLLMETEDVIHLEIRAELRALVRARREFTIHSQAVILACRRVDQVRRLLELPPPVGESRGLGPTSARDLLEAQRDLVDAMNSVVEAWIDYQIATLELLRDLEVLDPHQIEILNNGHFTPSSDSPDPEPGVLPDPQAMETENTP